MAGRVPGIVIAETWAALRRGPWNLSADVVAASLEPWADEARLVTTPVSAYVEVLRSGRHLQLGGNVHDHLISLTCAAHGLPLVTLDRRQSSLADRIAGRATTLLLDEA